MDPFHSLDILKNHFASVAFCRNSGVYNVQNGAVIELSFVVVCLPRPMEGMGRLQFSDLFFTELPVPPQAAGVVGTFNVLDIYPSEHYGLSFFGPYGCLFLLLFFYTFPFCKYTLYVCYVFNVNLTDSFDDRRSQCRLIE